MSAIASRGRPNVLAERTGDARSALRRRSNVASKSPMDRRERRVPTTEVHAFTGREIAAPPRVGDCESRRQDVGLAMERKVLGSC